MVPVPVYSCKVSSAVKNDAVKKSEYDKQIKNVNDINTTDTNNLVKKADTKNWWN